MKTRFTTADLFAAVQDCEGMVGMHCQNVYDIDTKTYLFKFHKQSGGKAMLLVESGSRLHPTEFEWPKSPAPSSFSMKLRKHIRSKRLKGISQLGVDRIVDLKFGDFDKANHVIIELYDRGNIVLTDHEYIILNILRPRTDRDTDVRFKVREKYPVELARQEPEPLMSIETLKSLILNAKKGENLRKILGPALSYGPAVLDNALRVRGLSIQAQVGSKITEENVPIVHQSLEAARELFLEFKAKKSQGFIITKTESSAVEGEKITTYQEFHPMLFEQHRAQCESSPNMNYEVFPTFGEAVDQFFSKLESQKIDAKALQQEKNAIKKLENFKKDHEDRLQKLQNAQLSNEEKASMIELNLDLVDRAITTIRTALANQLSWDEIDEMVQEGKAYGDQAASAIRKLQLEKALFTMALDDPFHASDSDEEDSDADGGNAGPIEVEIDVNYNAYQNARRYFDSKKQVKEVVFQAGLKEQKTLDASKKALKSAEAKTQEMLQQVQVKKTVQKQRKTFWFEKFLWFISSDNYMVVGGRDAQQNELLVKRYLRPGDVYVHADLRGASSVVVKNQMESDDAPPIPPRTLTEAGAMAVCYSAAWEAKVVAGAWWVQNNQVSKTAPSGEYLTPGSFMIRGKKNFLPASQLAMGFGYLFKLDEDCVEKHRGERGKAGLSREESVVEEGAVESEHVTLKDDDSEEEEKKDGSEEEFPDVRVSLQHLSVSQDDGKGEAEEEYTIHQVGPKRLEQSRHVRFSFSEEQGGDSDQDVELGKGGQPKRGQKHKQKKAKQKYADQDEEERKARMDLLASAGSKKEKKKKGKFKPKPGSGQGRQFNDPKPKPGPHVPPSWMSQPAKGILKNTPPSSPHEQEKVSEMAQEVQKDLTEQVTERIETAAEVEKPAEPEGPEDGQEKEEHAEEEEGDSKVELGETGLDALTATPFADDTLLFAVPVCAPYSALHGYKYKVKVTPGTNKKGKAIKTAIQMFIKDKTASERERDLMKASIDQDVSRNVPSKIKVSAPNLLAVKMLKKKS